MARRRRVQITPDGDYTQTGVEWNKHGYASPHHKQFVAAPERSGLYFFHARDGVRAILFVSLDRRAAQRRRQDRRARLEHHLERVQQFRRPQQLHPRGQLAADADRQRPAELKRYTDPEHLNYDTVDYAPLSFERPEPINHVPAGVEATDPIEGRAACHLAPAEWRLLALDRARRLRVRLLRRNAVSFRRARP